MFPTSNDFLTSVDVIAIKSY